MATKPPPKLGLEELAAQYGYAASFFFSSSELRTLIDQAVREQWTADKFRAKFLATTWYRQRAADQRTWAELEARDPAEAADRVANQSKLIEQMANEMGITIAPNRLRELATHSLVFAYPEGWLRELVAAEFRYQPGGGTQGQAATLETTIRRLAGDYGVTVSDGQIGQWVGNALAGKYSEDHLTDFIRDMARSKYAGMASYLEQGFTVRQVAEPYLQSYASILEVPYESVNLGDQAIQRALQGTVQQSGTQAGTPQMQGLYEFERGLRKDPRWQRTKQAREATTTAALGVLQDWGLYG